VEVVRQLWMGVGTHNIHERHQRLGNNHRINTTQGEGGSNNIKGRGRRGKKHSVEKTRSPQPSNLREARGLVLVKKVGKKKKKKTYIT